MVDDICSDKSLLMSLSKIRATQHEPVEEEDGIKYATRMVEKYRVEGGEQKMGTFEEFVGLSKESRDYIEYYLKKFDKEYSELIHPTLK
jgi:hypothetical protein